MTLGGTMATARVAALALLALVIVVVWVGPVGAYLDAIDAGADRLTQQQAVLLRYQALVRTSAEAAEPAPSPAVSPLLFSETAEAQAVALLQETVKGAAAASRIQIHSLQVLRGEALGDTAKIGVRIRAAGDVASLGQLLYAIESARPALYPDNLHVQAPPAVPGAASGNLDFQLDIAGFRAGSPS